MQSVEKFSPIFSPLLWRHRVIFLVLWRHKSKYRDKLNKLAKFQKNRWSRFGDLKNAQSLIAYDVTWWRHNANIETDFSSPSKNLSIDVSHVYRRPVEKFDPIFGPLLWRHRAIFWVLWRHRSKDREKLNKDGKFRKNRWSRFCGPQTSPIYCSKQKNSPPGKIKYGGARLKRLVELFF